LPGLGLFGALFTNRKHKSVSRKNILWMSLLGLLLLASLFALGCGGSNSKGQTPASQVTLTVTGTSGALSHTTPLTININ